MSVYHHVDGKDGLLDGVAEALWNETRPLAGGMGWKEELRDLAISLREVAHAHPNAYSLLLGRAPLPASALRAFDGAVRVLATAGLGRSPAVELVRILVSYAAGYAMLEISAPSLAAAERLEQIAQLTRGLPRDAPPSWST